jgi:drug/metabolite transporter (DMT)-like permease
MNPNSSVMIAAIAQVGVPPLRVALMFALIVFVFGGILLFRRRPQFFNRAPHVAGNGPVVRQNGEGIFIIVGSVLMLLLVGILHQVWSVT